MATSSPSFFIVWSLDHHIIEGFDTLLEAQIAAQKLASDNQPRRYYAAEVYYSVQATNILSHTLYDVVETKEPTCPAIS